MTDEKKYGDCKALSFYTYSVLKAIGIKSYVALINAKYNQVPVDPLFPSNHFNHMILCVPQKNDSIWLECTSRISDFNYLGSFTENRYALLITDEGGVLVPTPVSQPSKNSSSVVTQITLNEDGSGQSSSILSVKGDSREFMDGFIMAKKNEQKDFLINTLGFSAPDEFTCNKLNAESIRLDLQIGKIPQFSAGSKMFLNPRIYSFWSTDLPSTLQRRQDYFFRCAEDKTDTTVYHLPQGFTVDALPQAATAQCAYATYCANYAYDQQKNQLICTARLVLFKNRIPADQYAEVKSFFDELLAEESHKIVIKKD